jgi:tetratricopeptide (TPR) repeat protein
MSAETVPGSAMDRVAKTGDFDAVDELLAALTSRPGDVAVLRQLARHERVNSHHDLALLLLEAAAIADPADLDTTVDLAEVRASTRRHRAALAALDAGSAVPRVRECRAETLANMGLRALSFSAYGEPGTLEPAARRARLRLWRRTGGPLPVVRTLLRRRDERRLRDWPDDNPVPPADSALADRVRSVNDTDRRLAPVLARCDELCDNLRFNEAIAILREVDQPSAGALADLAYLEYNRSRPAAALDHLNAAIRLDPGDLDFVLQKAGLLSSLGRQTEALSFLEDLPAADQQTPEIRSALGGLYRELGLPWLARTAYGDPGTLDRSDRRDRRRSWWRSGGPPRLLLLGRPAIFERSCLRAWQWDCEPSRRAIAAIAWPSGFDVAGIQAETELAYLYPAMLDERLARVRPRARGFMQGFTILAVGVAVFVLGTGSWELSRWPAVLLAAGCALAAYGMRVQLLARFDHGPTWSGILARTGSLSLALLAGGYALTRLSWPNDVLPEIAGSILLGAVGGGFCFVVVLGPLGLLEYLGRQRHWRAIPRIDILDELFRLLDGLGDPDLRNNLIQRTWWMSKLDRAARLLEQDLPKSLHPTDQATTAWSDERSRAAAAAIRELKRLIAAPAGGSWARLEAELHHAVVMVAIGDFGRLRTARPPSPTMVRRTRMQTALTVVKTAALAVVPLVAALALQPWLNLDAKSAQWARLFGFGWAVLYVLFAADPSLRDKIDTAQRAASLVRSARQPGRIGPGDPADGPG